MLSERQRQILDGRERGQTLKEIAAALGISRHTVKHHLARALRKLHATNSAEAVFKRNSLRKKLATEVPRVKFRYPPD